MGLGTSLRSGASCEISQFRNDKSDDKIFRNLFRRDSLQNSGFVNRQSLQIRRSVNQALAAHQHRPRLAVRAQHMPDLRLVMMVQQRRVMVAVGSPLLSLCPSGGWARLRLSARSRHFKDWVFLKTQAFYLTGFTTATSHAIRFFCTARLLYRRSTFHAAGNSRSPQ